MSNRTLSTMLSDVRHRACQGAGMMIGLGLLAAASSWAEQPAATHTTALQQAVANPLRNAANVARDQYRHPAETLSFFDVDTDAVVVEIWPGRGWYTEILAQLLAEEGTLYAAHFPAQTAQKYFQKSRADFVRQLEENPQLYRGVKLIDFDPAAPAPDASAPKGEADRVLTFRNVHNWMKAGSAEQAFKQFYQMLKPGGILGVVEHRAKPGTSLADMNSSGYVTEDKVIELAKQAGFVLEERSEINANSKDTAMHPAGVWTLPPSLQLGDKDREKYLAIGESDRMTLRFRKPQ